MARPGGAAHRELGERCLQQLALRGVGGRLPLLGARGVRRRSGAAPRAHQLLARRLAGLAAHARLRIRVALRARARARARLRALGRRPAACKHSRICNDAEAHDGDGPAILSADRSKHWCAGCLSKRLNAPQARVAAKQTRPLPRPRVDATQ